MREDQRVYHRDRQLDQASIRDLPRSNRPSAPVPVPQWEEAKVDRRGRGRTLHRHQAGFFEEDRPDDRPVQWTHVMTLVPPVKMAYRIAEKGE